MFPAPLAGIDQRRPQAFRPGSVRARRARRLALRPVLFSLEQRVALTGNIAITSAAVVNASHESPSGLSAGQRVSIETEFTTHALPANASYRVSYVVNGLTLDTGYITNGAGLSRASSWRFFSASFIASPGLNVVTVTVDPDNSVAETSYADNTMNFSFSATLPAMGPFSYTVSQIRAAYGISSIPNFGSATADGSGQTIAIVDAYNDPSIVTDLDSFDRARRSAKRTALRAPS
jgi:hypothetical protein